MNFNGPEQLSSPCGGHHFSDPAAVLQEEAQPLMRNSRENSAPVQKDTKSETVTALVR